MNNESKIIEILRSKLKEALSRGLTLEGMNHSGFLLMRNEVDQLHALLHDPHEDSVEWMDKVISLVDSISMPIILGKLMKAHGYDGVADLLKDGDNPAPEGWEMPAELKKRWEGGQ